MLRLKKPPFLTSSALTLTVRSSNWEALALLWTLILENGSLELFFTPSPYPGNLSYPTSHPAGLRSHSRVSLQVGPSQTQFPRRLPFYKQHHWFPNESQYCAQLCSICCSVSVLRTLLVPLALSFACWPLLSTVCGTPPSTYSDCGGLLHPAQQAHLIPLWVGLMSSFNLYCPALAHWIWTSTNSVSWSMTRITLGIILD